jgi:hypothetical protein
MSYFNKWYFIVLILVIVGTFIYGYNNFYYLWDGTEMDEEILMEECGVTLEEYWERVEDDRDFCPNADKAEMPTGGMEVDWLAVALGVGVGIVVYNGLYFIYIKATRNSDKGKK